MEEKPNYYSIIPATVRYDSQLKANEKLLFGEITALSNAKGYCYSTNKYFSKLYGVATPTVSKWINHLKELGYVKVEMIKDGKEIKERHLFPVVDPINKKVNTPINKKVNTPINKKVNTPINKKVKENNTSINNTSINNKKENKKESRKQLSAGTSSDAIPYSEIVDYLNSKTGKQYRANTAKTRKLIKARFNEKYTFEDFKTVIDNQVADWGNSPKWSKYLRPDTLFGTKFENYLNNTPKRRPQNEGWGW